MIRNTKGNIASTGAFNGKVDIKMDTDKDDDKVSSDWLQESLAQFAPDYFGATKRADKPNPFAPPAAHQAAKAKAIKSQEVELDENSDADKAKYNEEGITHGRHRAIVRDIRLVQSKGNALVCDIETKEGMVAHWIDLKSDATERQQAFLRVNLAHLGFNSNQFKDYGPMIKGLDAFAKNDFKQVRVELRALPKLEGKKQKYQLYKLDN